MSNRFDIVHIRSLVEKRQIIWKRHALERMLERGITRKTVFDVILNGELIEDYSEDRPVPSGLFLGWNKKRPIHIVVMTTPDEDEVAIITVYEPTTEHFEPDFRARRKA